MVPYDYIQRRFQYVALALCIGIFTLLPNDINAQSSNKEYVVIGVFAIEKNAQRLIVNAKERNISAHYKIHPSRDLYFVYEETEDAWKERERIKNEFPEFYDVWVYEGQLGRSAGLTKNENTELVPSEEPQLIASNSKAEANPGISDVSSSEPAAGKEEVSEASNNPNVSNAKSQTETILEEEPVNIEPKENTYYLYFNTIHSKNLKEVKGTVNVIDPVRAKQLKEAKSHRIVEVKDPKNGSKTVKLSTSIFGFREVQQTVNLDQPVNDTTSAYVHTIGDSIIVDFELERYKKGDVLVMYNVYFFKDAAIMKPESIYELNALLDMLKENEKLVVKLHGHTNGNSHGKVLHLDLEDKNFFSLNANHKEDNGSAKKLSEYRAYTIQHWLMEQGIAEERIDIKGWGGKKMLYDKHDTQAFKNVRVEVEIVEE